jgi:hypothetical protein
MKTIHCRNKSIFSLVHRFKMKILTISMKHMMRIRSRRSRRIDLDLPVLIQGKMRILRERGMNI